jgi:Uma2 family endonuclease
MSAPVAEKLMTVEEFLALPDEEGVERWLIRGQLREKRGDDVTKRNRWHSKTEARIAQLLGDWLDRQPQPRGELYSGEAGFLLRRDPAAVVGIDVAYASPDVAAANPDDTTLIDGIPILAVEILSPSATEEETDEKLDLYLEVGVPLVWVVDPHFRTVMIYRPGAPPEMVNETQQLSGEPHLPVFVVPVASLFSR